MRANEVKTKADFFQFAAEHLQTGHSLINSCLRDVDGSDEYESIYEIRNANGTPLFEFSTISGLEDVRAENGIDDRYEY